MNKPENIVESRTNADGQFMRKESSQRRWIKKGTDIPPEKDRYHLYVCLACPWANGCQAVLNLKGLQDVISTSVVHPTWQYTKEDKSHSGWAFFKPGDPDVIPCSGHNPQPCDDALVEDQIGNYKQVREIQDSQEGAPTYSVPILFDKKEMKIVNNDSQEIMKMLNEEFNDFANNKVDLDPVETREKREEMNEWIQDKVNNGVQKCGFARTQMAQNTAVQELKDGLDKLKIFFLKQDIYVTMTNQRSRISGCLRP